MGRVVAWVALVGLVAWCGVACVSEERPSEGSPEAAQRAQPIINGSLDTTRDAVIAILGDQSLCSGTIIQTDPNRGLGWVLTAAHCVDDVPRYIAQGADFNDPDTYYEVVSYEAHPSYDSRDTTYDFAVIVFAGADRSTPVIPAVGASDGLREGGAVTSVGYGRTTPSYAQDTGNTRRRRVNRVISDLYQELIVYNISDAGICQGDSGGPVLANVNGQEKVVGVHSSVSGDCEGEGYSGRVTLVYSTWLVGQLGGEVEPSCELCQQVATSGNGECVPIIDDCNNSRNCSSLLECLQNCNTEACSQNCASDNPQGVQEYLAIFDCVCEDACPSECGGTDFCPEPAACGIAFSDETCNNCQERECCAEARDCGDDATCLGCLNGTVTQGCNNNGAFNDYFECLQGGCASECGIDEAPECGFTADGACGECLQGECCDEAAACADDEGCLACAQGDGEGCDTNRKLDAFYGCLAACDDDPCGIEEPSNNASNNENNANNNVNNNASNNTNNDTNNDSNNDSDNNAGANNSGPNNFNNNDGNNGGSDDNNNDANNNGGDEDDEGFVDSDSDGSSNAVTVCTVTATQARPASRGSLGGLLAAALGAFLWRRHRRA